MREKLESSHRCKQDMSAQLAEVQMQLSYKERCLSDVREWGQLKEPDETLVGQLVIRERSLCDSQDKKYEALQQKHSLLELKYTMLETDCRKTKDANASLEKSKTPEKLLNRALEAEVRVRSQDAALQKQGKELNRERELCQSEQLMRFQMQV